MTRPFVFGTNFKMNQTPGESVDFFTRLNERVDPSADARLYVIPPITSVPAVAVVARELKSDIWVGAQNMHWAAEGAYTGEVSAAMLLSLGVNLVLVGHAERRRLFKETDPDLNLKVRAALDAGLRVIFAVGETAEDRGYGVSAETVVRQLKIGLHGAHSAQMALMHIAYEPVWSIGAGGTPASPEDVEPIAALIRGALGDLFGARGRDTPILYGGSVDAANAGSFTSLADIDGVLVGRAGWTVEGFVATYDAGLAGYASKPAED
jgi:L-erythrulose 1-phosphate isomerase